MDALTPVNNWAYGVGHFLNDLAAACWFNFLLVYLTNFNPIDKTNPGFYAGYFFYFKSGRPMWLDCRRFGHPSSRIFLRQNQVKIRAT
jgi:hypothetical protein